MQPFFYLHAGFFSAIQEYSYQSLLHFGFDLLLQQSLLTCAVVVEMDLVHIGIVFVVYSNQRPVTHDMDRQFLVLHRKYAVNHPDVDVLKEGFEAFGKADLVKFGFWNTHIVVVYGKAGKDHAVIFIQLF